MVNNQNVEEGLLTHVGSGLAMEGSGIFEFIYLEARISATLGLAPLCVHARVSLATYLVASFLCICNFS